MRAVAVAVAVGLVSLLGVADDARASLILLLDQRSVQGGSLPAVHPDPPFSSFYANPGDLTGVAFQQSSISSDLSQIVGDGYVALLDTGGGFGIEPFPGSSVLQLRFGVATPQPFTMSGSIYGSNASAFLADSTGIFHLLGPDLGLTGMLEPGLEYTLFVGVDESAGSFHVEFSVPVPEPSLAILLLGLAPLLARRASARAVR